MQTNPSAQDFESNLKNNSASPVPDLNFSKSDKKIRHLSLSTRARNVLKSIGVKTLSNLHEIPHDQILGSKSCGIKTYEEIVRAIRDSKDHPNHVSSSSTDHSQKPIQIPEEARSWPVHLLPLSTRLQNALRRLHCQKLEDIHHLSYRIFMEMPDCGNRTLTELRNFVSKIEEGEFGISHECSGQAPANFLVSSIDAFLASIDHRSRSIFMDRAGAYTEPMTLMKVGQKYSMTRERIRQIIDLLTKRCLRFGGPPFAHCINSFAQELNHQVLPLTPLLFEKLLDPQQKKPEHSLSFYIRLIGWLSPELSVWPIGQTPAAYRIPKQEQIIQSLKRWFTGRTSLVKTSQVYQDLQKTDPSFSAFEFLEALKFAAEFEIDLKDPFNPLIHPPIAIPRRWARQLLSEAKTSSVSPDELARAKAFLFSRRSPASRYRLANAKRF